MFKSSTYADVSLNRWMALTPPELVQGTLKLDRSVMSALRRGPAPVVPVERLTSQGGNGENLRRGEATQGLACVRRKFLPGVAPRACRPFMRKTRPGMRNDALRASLKKAETARADGLRG